MGRVEEIAMDSAMNRVCVVPMISCHARCSVNIDCWRKQIEEEAIGKGADYVLVYQTVVDLPRASLRKKEHSLRELIFEGVSRRKYGRLILFGDVLTEFGREIILEAKRVDMDLRFVAFGTGPFRRYASLFQRHEVYQAYHQAEVLGIIVG